MSTENKQKTWAEKCAQSKGTMVMVPTEFAAELDKLFKQKDEVIQMQVDLNKKDMEAEHAWKTWWHNVRAAVAKLLGDKVVYAPGSKMGINVEAKEEGIWVINLGNDQQ
jgi:hypothetical protein